MGVSEISFSSNAIYHREHGDTQRKARKNPSVPLRVLCGKKNRSLQIKKPLVEQIQCFIFLRGIDQDGDIIVAATKRDHAGFDRA